MYSFQPGPGLLLPSTPRTRSVGAGVAPIEHSISQGELDFSALVTTASVQGSSLVAGKNTLFPLDKPYLCIITSNFVKDATDPLALNIYQGNQVRVLAKTADSQWAKVEVVIGQPDQIGRHGEVPMLILSNPIEESRSVPSAPSARYVIEAYAQVTHVEPPQNPCCAGLMNTLGGYEDPDEDDEGSEGEKASACDKSSSLGYEPLLEYLEDDTAIIWLNREMDPLEPIMEGDGPAPAWYKVECDWELDEDHEEKEYVGVDPSIDDEECKKISLLGLHFDPKTGTVSGVPNKSGNYVLTITPCGPDGTAGEPFDQYITVKWHYPDWLPLAAMLILFAILVPIPFFSQLIWSSLKIQGCAELMAWRNAHNFSENISFANPGLVNAEEHCRVMPYSYIDLLPALGIVLFVKIAFADTKLGKGKRERTGRLRIFEYASICNIWCNWIIPVVLTLGFAAMTIASVHDLHVLVEPATGDLILWRSHVYEDAMYAGRDFVDTLKESRETVAGAYDQLKSEAKTAVKAEVKGALTQENGAAIQEAKDNLQGTATDTYNAVKGAGQDAIGNLGKVWHGQADFPPLDIVNPEDGLISSECVHFSDWDPMFHAANQWFAGWSIWLFGLGCVVMTIGEMMKLKLNETYLGHHMALIVDPLLPKYFQVMCGVSEEEMGSWEGPINNVMRSLGGDANNEGASEGTADALQGDLNGSYWPGILQAFGNALWLCVLAVHFDKASGCVMLNEEEFAQDKKKVMYYSLWALFGVDKASNVEFMLWFAETIGLIVMLLFVVIVFCGIPFCRFHHNLRRCGMCTVGVIILLFTILMGTATSVSRRKGMSMDSAFAKHAAGNEPIEAPDAEGQEERRLHYVLPKRSYYGLGRRHQLQMMHEMEMMRGMGRSLQDVEKVPEVPLCKVDGSHLDVSKIPFADKIGGKIQLLWKSSFILQIGDFMMRMGKRFHYTGSPCLRFAFSGMTGFIVGGGAAHLLFFSSKCNDWLKWGGTFGSGLLMAILAMFFAAFATGASGFETSAFKKKAGAIRKATTGAVVVGGVGTALCFCCVAGAATAAAVGSTVVALKKLPPPAMGANLTFCLPLSCKSYTCALGSKPQTDNWKIVCRDDQCDDVQCCWSTPAFRSRQAGCALFACPLGMVNLQQSCGQFACTEQQCCAPSGAATTALPASCSSIVCPEPLVSSPGAACPNGACTPQVCCTEQTTPAPLTTQSMSATLWPTVQPQPSTCGSAFGACPADTTLVPMIACPGGQPEGCSAALCCQPQSTTLGTTLTPPLGTTLTPPLGTTLTPPLSLTCQQEVTCPLDYLSIENKDCPPSGCDIDVCCIEPYDCRIYQCGDLKRKPEGETIECWNTAPQANYEECSDEKCCTLPEPVTTTPVVTTTYLTCASFTCPPAPWTRSPGNPICQPSGCSRDLCCVLSGSTTPAATTTHLTCSSFTCPPNPWSPKSGSAICPTSGCTKQFCCKAPPTCDSLACPHASTGWSRKDNPDVCLASGCTREDCCNAPPATNPSSGGRRLPSVGETPARRVQSAGKTQQTKSSLLCAAQQVPMNPQGGVEYMTLNQAYLSCQMDQFCRAFVATRPATMGGGTPIKINFFSGIIENGVSALYDVGDLDDDIAAQPPKATAFSVPAVVGSAGLGLLATAVGWFVISRATGTRPQSHTVRDVMVESLE